MNAISLKWNEPMDTMYYELGSSSECIVCQAKKKALSEKNAEREMQFQAAITTFILSKDSGSYRKQALLEINSQ